MGRGPRIKSEDGIYHIMVRSISELLLFKENKDKEKYLTIIEKYQKLYKFKVYGYCLMSTHGHFCIDCCGADISKIMKSINQSYVYYYNKKYNRHGHLFADRFKSILVINNKYLLVLINYIHNNPKDIEGYKKRVEKYKYSSLKNYLGLAEDKIKILDIDYILHIFDDDKSKARKRYMEFIQSKYNSIEEMDLVFKKEGYQYKNERKILIRNIQPEKIIHFIEKYTDSKFNVHIKFNHKNSDLKSLCVLIMRSLCGFTYKEICNYVGNVTSSNVWKLCEKGLNLINTQDRYKNLIEDLLIQF